MIATSEIKYNLKERTFKLAKNVIEYVDNLPKKVSGFEIGKQLVRSAGSVGANYIEADEALSKKDFVMRIKICKKEAKETRYWLELSQPIPKNINIKKHLVCESTELIKIFATIVNKTKI